VSCIYSFKNYAAILNLFVYRSSYYVLIQIKQKLFFMKKKFLFTLFIALGLGITSTQAQVKKREVRQHERIHQGVKSGELTHREAKKLRSNEKDIHHDIKDAKADGKITPAERKDIRKDENKNSREIYRKKHNNRTRK